MVHNNIWAQLRLDPESLLVGLCLALSHSRLEEMTHINSCFRRDVGPFRYWTLQQLPNFLLAAPVLALSFAASYTYYSSQPHLILSKTLPFIFTAPPTSTTTPPRRMFLDLSLLPFIHLHTATTLLLLISSHVQIILRLCIVNPVIWWYATDLVLSTGLEAEKRRRWGTRWIWYSVIWGTISIVCWALFLPPA